MSETDTIVLHSPVLSQTSPMTPGFTNGMSNNRSASTASSTRSPKTNNQAQASAPAPASAAPAPAPAPPLPPPKTDKPRPHICATCTRSFARLEHLKRHERSHTKEKPFECPECARCFARRDLLLRHQQKLHMTTTPSSRPRNGGRRESTSSVATTSRVRKNSVTTGSTTATTTGTTTASTMRPRANTLSHIDSSTLEMLAQAQSNAGHNHSRGGIASIGTNTGNSRGLPMPKLNTSSLGGLDYSGPSSAGPTLPDIGLDSLLFGTVNPAALHFNNYSPQLNPSIGTPTSPFGPPYHMDSQYSIDEYDDEGFEWMHGLHQSHLEEGGSPSAISTTSASAISEVMLDNTTMWNNSVGMNASAMNYAEFTQSNFHDTPPPAGTVSPRSLMAQNSNDHHQYFNASPPIGNVSPAPLNQNHFPNHYYASERSASSSTSLGSGSSMTSISAESITDATRAALLATLAGSSTFGATHFQNQQRRRYSTSTSSPPTSASFASVNLPSTRDLQRYVTAYIRYFHPHLPFLHIPTLNFDSSIYTNTYKNNSGQRSGINGGGGCLILSIAAIGALYEFEVQTAKEIFEAAKKTVGIFLEDRRKADITAAAIGINNGSMNGAESIHNTPVWLVQAMLLNVIFGLHCGDKLACEIAMNHCAALVSLARAAGLTRPSPVQQQQQQGESDIHMSDMDFTTQDWSGLGIKSESDEHEEWTSWAAAEERKRTLYAVHLLSSLLVAAHNMPPTLMNNEIRLDLPCDEELWAADSAAMWQARGGSAAAAQSSVNFSVALNELLSSGQQQYGPVNPFQSYNQHTHQGGMTYTPSQTPLSTFGCLVLICAIHVYIWETRQRQHTRHWASAEAEAVHAQIEPALKAWSGAWMATQHSMESPKSPYSLGPLSADSIPLLDLAYIRLYVDMGRSKEAFWNRDFEVMAEELARGYDYSTQPNNHGQGPSPSSTSSVSGRSDSPLAEISPASSPASSTSSPNLHTVRISGTSSLTRTATTSNSASSSKRESFLRKAAVYAADSLSMSETWGILSCHDTACRELPIQSALCTFDCAQVLAEWIATVQERVGPYMGVLGSEECNLESLEGLMMLEGEDRKLLIKVMKLVRDAEMKLAMEWSLNAGMPGNRGPRNISTDGGLGTKVLRIHACLLEKVVVWPVTRLMAHALRAQAEHMENRTKNGTLSMGR